MFILGLEILLDLLSFFQTIKNKIAQSDLHLYGSPLKGTQMKIVKLILSALVIMAFCQSHANNGVGELNSIELIGPKASMQNPQVSGNVKLCAWSRVLQNNERFIHSEIENAFIISADETVIETLVELVAEAPDEEDGDMEVCGEGVYEEIYGFAGRTLQIHLHSIK